MRSEYIEPGDLDRLCRAFPEWSPLFRLCRETGLRVGDAVALPASALRGCTVLYRAQKTGKTGAATVTPYTARRLRAGRGSRWLFPSPYDHKKHLTRQAVWYRIKRAATVACVPPDGVSPHSLRKAFAVDLYQREGLEAVKNALQHANADTTEIYALADFTSPRHADTPLFRGDIPLICRIVRDYLAKEDTTPTPGAGHTCPAADAGTPGAPGEPPETTDKPERAAEAESEASGAEPTDAPAPTTQNVVLTKVHG